MNRTQSTNELGWTRASSSSIKQLNRSHDVTKKLATAAADHSHGDAEVIPLDYLSKPPSGPMFYALTSPTRGHGSTGQKLTETWVRYLQRRKVLSKGTEHYTTPTFYETYSPDMLAQHAATELKKKVVAAKAISGKWDESRGDSVRFRLDRDLGQLDGFVVQNGKVSASSTYTMSIVKMADGLPLRVMLAKPDGGKSTVGIVSSGLDCITFSDGQKWTRISTAYTRRPSTA